MFHPVKNAGCLLTVSPSWLAVGLMPRLLLLTHVDGETRLNTPERWRQKKEVLRFGEEAPIPSASSVSFKPPSDFDQHGRNTVNLN